MPQENKISACLVVYNEEKVIERCLSSIKNLVDEIILVHDGECDDRTLEIAKKYTDKIFVRPRARIMEAHIVFAFKQASFNWLLRIDADEFFDEADVAKIKELVKNDSVSGYSFRWELWDGKTTRTTAGMNKLCLYRDAKYSYCNIPNAGGKVDGKVQYTDIFLHHKSSTEHVSWQSFFRRMRRFMPLEINCFFPDLALYPFECYNTTIDPWLEFVAKVKKRPYLYMLFYSLKTLLGQLKNGLWKSFFGINIALQQYVYQVILYWKIWQMDRKLKSR